MAVSSSDFLVIDCGCHVLSESDWRKVLSQKSLSGLCSSSLAESLAHGVPESLRTEVWAFLSKAKFLLGPANDFVYTRRLKSGRPPCTSLIERDLSRTFPQHPDFATRQSEGQIALANILRAYALYDPDVGYCQGMAFIAGLLYQQMKEEEIAFWTFVQIMWVKDWRSMFLKGTPKLCTMLDTLSRDIFLQLPEVAEHMLREDVGLATAFTQSLLTICSCDLPFDLAVRVMDLFIIEGEKVLLGLILSTLRIKRTKLMQLRAEVSAMQELFAYLRTGLLVECHRELGAITLLGLRCER